MVRRAALWDKFAPALEAVVQVLLEHSTLLNSPDAVDHHTPRAIAAFVMVTCTGLIDVRSTHVRFLHGVLQLPDAQAFG